MTDDRKLTEMPCSRCGKTGLFDLQDVPAHFPFCSMRCKTLDLGDWLEPAEDEDEPADAASNGAP